MNFLGKIFVGFLILAYAVLTGGLVIDCYWDWFLIAAFPSVPAITFMQAVCVSMFASVVFKSSSHKIFTKEAEDKIATGVMILIAPWFSLLIGWIIQFFIN